MDAPSDTYLFDALRNFHTPSMAAATADKKLSASNTAQMRVNKIVMAQYAKWYKAQDKMSPHYIILPPDKDNLCKWTILICNLDAPFEGGEYYMTFQFPDDFPTRSPKQLCALTPSGVFELGGAICISIGEFHDKDKKRTDVWRPSMGGVGFAEGILASFLNWEGLDYGIRIVRHMSAANIRAHATSSYEYNRRHNTALHLQTEEFIASNPTAPPVVKLLMSRKKNQVTVVAPFDPHAAAPTPASPVTKNVDGVVVQVPWDGKIPCQKSPPIVIVETPCSATCTCAKCVGGGATAAAPAPIVGVSVPLTAGVPPPVAPPVVTISPLTAPRGPPPPRINSVAPSPLVLSTVPPTIIVDSKKTTSLSDNTVAVSTPGVPSKWQPDVVAVSAKDTKTAPAIATVTPQPSRPAPIVPIAASHPSVSVPEVKQVAPAPHKPQPPAATTVLPPPRAASVIISVAPQKFTPGAPPPAVVHVKPAEPKKEAAPALNVKVIRPKPAEPQPAVQIVQKAESEAVLETDDVEIDVPAAASPTEAGETPSSVGGSAVLVENDEIDSLIDDILG